MRSIRSNSRSALRGHARRRRSARKLLAGVLTALALLAPGLASPALGDDPRLSGGASTVFVTRLFAYSHPTPGLEPAMQALFDRGRTLFFVTWEEGSRVPEMAGRLGPTFNRERCSGCHLRNGRGWTPTAPDEEFYAMLLRISVPGTDAFGGPKPHPVYGRQIQNHAVEGVPAEAHPQIEGEAAAGAYLDGWSYSLVTPEYILKDLAFGELGSETMISARIALPMIGLGLLEAVPAETLYGLADPFDEDGDGISGRVNIVWDREAGGPALGRFGWKAGMPSIRQQTAAAAAIDMGVTSSLFPLESCGPGQDACAAARSAGDPELSDAMLDALTFYASTLAVPARRQIDDPVVGRGEQVFAELDCTACHTPTMVTGEDALIPALAGQVIHPYTDLLLHDMGEALADHRPEFLASGREWRTPPLWAIGLQSTVSKRQSLLHDGRAQGFAEAILWHGGEAEASREAFRRIPTTDRTALLAFLNSL